MGDGRWGGPDTGGGRLNTRYGRRGGKKDERREETGKMFFEQGTRTNLGGGGGRKEPNSARTGNIESLK